MTYIQAIIIAVIEGITEYLPISSTGHMIISSSLMGISGNAFVKLFTVCVQLGAILSVIVLYFKRFFKSIDFYYKLLIAFIPAAIFGKLLGDYIDVLLENPLGVGISLLLGGVILLFVDKLFNKSETDDADKINVLTAFKIGLFQCIALIPGVSRSGATIVGGMSQKMSRKAAAEFSFFLAVPTMFAATVYKLYKYTKEFGTPTNEELKLLAIGNIVAFVVALMAIKSFIGILNKHGFKLFGWYRIVVGIIIIILFLNNPNLSII
jgi:undecaprenyl-diphosphatase